MQRASLQQNIFSLYALQGANYLIPLITLPFLVRALGLEAYGLISFAYALTFFMVLFVDAGFNLSASRELAAIDQPAEHGAQIRSIFWRTQIIKLGLALACLCVLCVLLLTLPALRMHWSIYLVSFLTVLGSLVFPVWVFQGLEQMRYTTALFLGGRIVSAIGIVTLVREPHDALLAAFLQSSATLLSGLLAWPFLLRHFKLYWAWPGWSVISAHFKLGRSYFASDFFANALSNSTVFTIGLFHGKEVVGAFSAIEKLARALASGLGPLQKALFPRVAARYAQSASAGWQFARKLIVLLISSAWVGAIILLFIAPFVLNAVFGSTLVPYADTLRWFAIWIALFIGNAAMGDYALVARGHTKSQARCQSLAALVLLLGLPMTTYVSSSTNVLEHAAVVMVASQAVFSVALLFALFRHAKTST